MIIILIIFGLTLAAGLLLTAHRYTRALPEQPAKTTFPFPPHSAGLFAEEDEPNINAEEELHNRRRVIIERAALGEMSALAEAQAEGEASLYAQVLDALIDAFARQGTLPTLVNHIASSNGLRGNLKLAERVIQSWKLAPGRRSTIEMIHIAALSDDAEIYGKAVELALEAWRSGKLSDLKAEELAALVESQYWVLATEARSGGAGYSLKRRLAAARRALTAATTARG